MAGAATGILCFIAGVTDGLILPMSEYCRLGRLSPHKVVDKSKSESPR